MSDVSGGADFPPLQPDAWDLDPAVVMLNHGSFGACPRAVLQYQAELRRQMEAQPVRFLARDLPPLLDEARATLAACVGGEAANLVFVANATAGVNAVLRSLRFRPGDAILVTNQGYNACTNVAQYVAQRDGAQVVSVEPPVPCREPGAIVAAVLAAVTPRTRLALIDHVTSPTAMVFPVAEVVRALQARGVDTLVDGAHAPGMVPLNLRELGAAYYTGNCHKWLCAPKGAGFLYVRPDRQEGLQPPVVSHGYNRPRPGHSRFQDAFDWQGTDDPTARLSIGEALGFLSRLHADGLPGVIRRNHALACAASRMLHERLPLAPLCGPALLGSMAAFHLPDSVWTASGDRAALLAECPLGNALYERFGIEVPVFYWPDDRRAVLRISCQAYNGWSDYERLAEALTALGVR